MADELCETFPLCQGLDARLLFNRTVTGPAFALDLAEIPFGPVSLDGASLHPSVTWTYGQTWSAREVCRGPIRSVFGLAPGETATLTVRRRQEVDLKKMVQRVVDSSTEKSRLEGEPRQTSGGGGVSDEQASDIDKARYEEALRDQMADVELEKIKHMKGSSFWEDLAEPFVEAAKAVTEAISPSEEEAKHAYADSVATMHEHESGAAAGTINGDTLGSIDNVLNRLQTSESNHSLTETTSSERTVEEQSLQRVFVNPYRDRSLQLRFIPVFRRFEVITQLVKSEPGLFLNPGAVNFGTENVRPKLSDFIARRVNPSIITASLVDVGEEDDGQGVRRGSAVKEHLRAHRAVYTRQFIHYLHNRGDRSTLLSPFAALLGGIARRSARANAAPASPGLAQAFAWSRAGVRADGIHVPLAALENSLSVFSKAAATRLGKAINSTVLNPTWLKKWISTKSVHVFIGTHIEAVAGECVLPDVPPVG